MPLLGGITKIAQFLSSGSQEERKFLDIAAVEMGLWMILAVVYNALKVFLGAVKTVTLVAYEVSSREYQSDEISDALSVAPLF